MNAAYDPGVRQRCGRWLLAAGFLLTCASLATSVAGGKLGLILGLAGLALGGGWPAAGRWVWAAGTAAATWALGSVLLAGLRDGGPLFERSGVLYTWLAFPVALAAAADLRLRRWGWNLMLAGMLTAAVLAALQYATGYAADANLLRLSGDGVRHDRISGFFHHHYPFAMVLVLIGIAAAFRADPVRWRGPLLLAIAAIVAVVSASRAVLLALPAAVAAGTMTRGRHLLRAGAIAIGLLAVAVLALWFAAPDLAREVRDLRSGRFYVWQLTFSEIGEHPWLGAGGQKRYQAAGVARLPQRPADVPEAWWFADGPPHAHNTLLTLAGWYGVPTAALHLLLMAAILLAMHRQSGTPALRIGIAITVLVETAGLFDFTIGDAETAATTFTLLGLLAGDGTPAQRGDTHA